MWVGASSTAPAVEPGGAGGLGWDLGLGGGHGEAEGVSSPTGLAESSGDELQDAQTGNSAGTLSPQPSSRAGRGQIEPCWGGQGLWAPFLIPLLSNCVTLGQDSTLECPV